MAQGSAAPQLFATQLHAHVLSLIAIKQIKQIGPLSLHFDSLRGGLTKHLLINIILNTHIKVLYYIPLHEGG